MKQIAVLFFSIVLVAATSNMAVAQDAQTFVIGRTGVQDDATATYRYTELFQQRGRWIFPDIGYIDFADAKQYREYFIGAGAVLFTSKRITIIEEGYLDKAAGPASGDALYFQPWTLVAVNLTPKLNGEVVYFPYLPLNKAGRIQHVLERAKLEYDFKRFKVGAGYGAYQYGDGPWSNRPFVTTTLKGGKLGDLELWLQRMSSNHTQLQVRYAKMFR